MKKTMIIVSLFFSYATAYGSAPITHNESKCTNLSIDTLEQKISTFDRFKYVDQSILEPAFLKANLVVSTNTGDTASGGNRIAFAIKPVPILDNYVTTYPLNPKEYPRFYADCGFDRAGLSFQCKQIMGTQKYVIDDFELRMSVTENSPRCRQDQLLLHIGYSIVINNHQYSSIVQKLKSVSSSSSYQKKVDEMANQETFFQEYWKAFLTAWEKENWHQG